LGKKLDIPISGTIFPYGKSNFTATNNQNIPDNNLFPQDAAFIMLNEFAGSMHL